MNTALPAFALSLLLGALTACALIEPPPPHSNPRDVVADEALAQPDGPYRYQGGDEPFDGAQVVADPTQTSANHSSKLAALDLPAKISAMFAEESKRVANALASGGMEMLAILPGKHLPSMLSGVHRTKQCVRADQSGSPIAQSKAVEEG